ncbi:MAG: hypothetical protein DIU80_014695 [Chloroflexota bacterium]
MNEEPFLWALFQQLRRRRFALAPEDYEELRAALRLGFGWDSREALRELCCALWAKSRREQETLRALFQQLAPPDLDLLAATDAPSSRYEASGPARDEAEPPGAPEPQGPEPQAAEAELWPTGGLPPITLGGAPLSERPFVFAPQFPLSYREVAQAWRRLRQPVREGPPVELDIDATVARRSRTGVPGPPALVPRRRNTARLLLLVDRHGSMAPFHIFVDEVCAAIVESGRLKQAARYYFHDTPASGADDSLLEELGGAGGLRLDPVLPRVQPLDQDDVYEDADLLKPRRLAPVLDAFAGASVVLISDAGAARGRVDLLRLLDTTAFLKALAARQARVVWLNPLPRSYWARSTAAQIARHVAMLPLDREGIHRAVNVLRGQPTHVERPI